jgi:uncharacterized damage-inducible protein DinB
MAAPIRGFSEVRARLIEALRAFPAHNRNDILFGEWSLKDVIGHLTGWDRYFTAALKSHERGEAPPFWGDITEFNRASVARRKGSSWKKVYDEFVAAGEEFIRAYSQVPEPSADERLWKGKPYTPVSIVDINTHHYGTSHLPQIEKAMARLSRSRDA